MLSSALPPAAWVTHPWVEASAADVHFAIANGPRGDWPALAEFVAALEELGYDAFWSSDHPVPSAGCWTTLAGLAATTRRIRLGSLVACLYYLKPVVLARMALDVDAMSGGRLVLGLGIGDLEREFAQMGIPWRGTRERQEALDETISLLRYLWGEAPDPPPPQHFAVSASPLLPGPVQQPRIPLLIAGGGERVTLRQVAQHADASNFGEHAYTGGVQGAEAIGSRIAALTRHCQVFGRSPASVLRTHTTYPLVIAATAANVAEKVERYVPPWVRDLARDTIVAGTPNEVIAHYERLMRAGLQYFIAFVYGNDLETIRLLAEAVIPEVRHSKAKAELTEPVGDRARVSRVRSSE
jgi:alkanesulfonate monooxygenase SsuD/methylene tetrahydromethanopterin reductase-like flavin-dependent oxidoreductase (luciferase family)